MPPRTLASFPITKDWTRLFRDRMADRLVPQMPSPALAGSALLARSPILEKLVRNEEKSGEVRAFEIHALPL
jgi:hypothetical protein